MAHPHHTPITLDRGHTPTRDRTCAPTDGTARLARQLLVALCALASALFVLPTASAQEQAGLLYSYQRALKYDAIYLQALYQYQATVEAYPTARAALLPQVRLTAGAGRSEPQGTNRGDAYNTQSSNLTISQTIYNRMQSKSLSRAALVRDQAQIDLALAEQSLILRTAQLYFAALDAHYESQFAQTEALLIHQQLTGELNRYTQGLTTLANMQVTEVAYDTALARQLLADRALADARDRLTQLTGDDQMPLLLLSEYPATPPQPTSPEYYLGLADQHNLMIRRTKISHAVANSTIAVQRAQHLPSLTLSGSYADQFSGAGAVDTNNYLTNVQLQLNLPIYTGGATSALVRQAIANTGVAQAQLTQQRRETARSVRAAYRGILTNIARIDVLQQAVDSADRSVQSTQVGFNNGSNTITELLNALRATYTQQLSYHKERHSYALGTLQLNREIGTLKAEDLEGIDLLLERP